MKTFPFKKIIAFIFCSLIFISAITAQDKPQAIKFAEYNDEAGNMQTLAEKAESFARRLQQEPAMTRGFIAYFRGSSYLSRNQSRYSEVFIYLKDFATRNESRIDKEEGLQWGGRSLNYSIYARAEFWIVPKDAEYPDIRAHECGLVECPTVGLEGDETVKNVREPQTFIANVRGGFGEEIEYRWTISAGNIIEGQGTPVIRVDLSNVKDKEVKIHLELDGVPDVCVREATLTTEISDKPELIDDFGLEIDEQMRSRTDNLLARLRDNPTAKGFIFNYDSQTNSKFLKVRRAQIEEQFSRRPIELTSRISIINGGYRENPETEIWLSFDENQKPVPTPTVNKKFVETRKPMKKPRK